MRITTFKNMKGLIHGAGPKRIGCDKDGILKIGTTEINISAGQDEIMPLLFHGCDGEYHATFTDTNGDTYALEKVSVRGGRITPPHPSAVEIMELRYRLDKAEERCVDLAKQIDELSQIFDTNSLNFLLG